MAPKPIGTVFFDLGDTLGTPELSPPPIHLAGFHVFPFVPELLEQLRSRGLKLGIISNTGSDTGPKLDAILSTAGILASFNDTLRIYSADVGLTKADPAIFKLAAQRAGSPDQPATCLFVGEDPQERAIAASAGLRVCPHPLLAPEVIDGEKLRYVRITAPADLSITAFRAALRARPIVPMHVAGSGGRVVYAITSERVVAELINMRLGVELLGDSNAPENTELFLLRDDTARSSGYLSGEGQASLFFADRENAPLLVSATAEGLVIALPHGRSLGELHLKRAKHGHTLKLMPDPMLLLDPVANPAVRAFAAAFDRPAALQTTLTPSEIQALRGITVSVIRDRITRYSGAADIGGGSAERVKSRHISHPQNATAVDALAAEFAAIGNGRLTVKQQRFSHRGRSLLNIEAELAGSSNEVVLVTAHLDSTAASTPGYDEETDDAPGADDDASGIAAVLSIAERFVAMSQTAPLARTIRFVLFNAEEEGLVGSRVYARQQRSISAPIVAVYQMDMIGFNKVPPRDWEVHAGFESSLEVEKRSVTLAKLLRRLAPDVSPALDPPELFQTNGDPDLDPASGRSDHASFQAHGYAAICASEDFFVVNDQGGTIRPDENPNYHTEDDRVDGVDAEFAADIARAVAAAAWITAQSGVQTFADSRSFSRSEARMAGQNKREIDTRRQPGAVQANPARAVSDEPSIAPPSSTFGAPAQPGTVRAPESRGSARRVNALTGTPVLVTAATAAAGFAELADDAAATPAEPRNVIDKAMAFVQQHRGSLGFGSVEVAEFDPDPVVQRTSSGSMAVHLHQSYRGIPVFQMTRTVRFTPQGDVVDAAGDNAPLPQGIDIKPTLDAPGAALKAAQHLASSGAGETYVDRFKQTQAVPTVDATGFEPHVLSAFPLPSRPTVLEKGPFENPIPAHLVIFNQPQSRLAWYLVLTFPDYADQYAVIVSADDMAGEILYSKSTMHRAVARGKVFEFSPGVASRKLIDFPRAVSDFPAMPAMPLTNFPSDWVDVSQTVGNTVRATLNFGTNSLSGTLQNGRVVFDPAQEDGDDQKLLNIFYFCNYIHDFLFILGFDEAAGNFQLVNFTHAGTGGDPVRARAHSGAVNGTANMSTGIDGQPPVMNMGLVVSTNRHTAFDADVVFHGAHPRADEPPGRWTHECCGTRRATELGHGRRVERLLRTDDSELLPDAGEGGYGRLGRQERGGDSQRPLRRQLPDDVWPAREPRGRARRWRAVVRRTDDDDASHPPGAQFGSGRLPDRVADGH